MSQNTTAVEQSMMDGKIYERNPSLDSNKIREKLTTARIALLIRQPFFGNLATRLTLQDATDWCATAATDGRHFFYNENFIDSLNQKQTEFLFGHEILHCVYDHFTRRDDRDPQIYNIAADYCVNGDLIRHNIGEVITQVKPFHDPKYYGWASEAVYDDIFKKYDEEQLKQLGKLLDEHIDWEKGQGEGPNGKTKKDKSGKGKQPSYSKEELKKIRDEMKEAMVSAAQAAGVGNVPKGVARLIKDLTEPKMDWRELLNQQIQSVLKSNYTFMRPSRKAWHTGAVLPGMDFDQTIDIAIALDMSGSIGTKEAQDFLGEVKGICDQYDDYKIKVWCFDTEIYNEQDFTPDSGEGIEDYELQGGGGTDFDANWRYMKDNDIEPKKLIVFTDGYSWNWGDENYCDTIWVIHSDTSIEAPHGITCHYDAKSQRDAA
jgi:predicted metal-dependent peptidase